MVKCRVCGHKWEPRTKEPMACPKCKRYDWKERIKILAIVIFSLLFIPNLVHAASWTTLTQPDFNLGTYFNTTYNTTGGFVMLNNTTTVVYSPFGNYTSKIFDASATAQWNNISWIEGVPYGEELPDNKRVETVLGGANMTGNVLLMHLNSVNNTNYTLDSSGEGNDGRLYNYSCSPATCNLTTGKFNNSLNFDGVNDYVSVTLPAINKQNIAVSVWVKPTKEGHGTGWTNADPIWYIGDGSNSLGMFYQSDRTIHINGFIQTSGSTSDTIPLNVWSHIIVTQNSSRVTIYFNGALSYSYATTEGVGTPSNFYLSKTVGMSSYYFNGTIDEVAIFNRTLSADEILNLYKRGALKLNITTRSCNDAACSGENWNETHNNATLSNLKEQNNQYFQYKAQFETDNTSYTPELYNVTVNYTIPFIVSSNATTSKRGDFINITITSSSAVSVNITRPNGSVSWLATPVSKGSNTYGTNYTFFSTDSSGSYRIGANSSTYSNTTNVTMSSVISVTLESDEMSVSRKISTRSGSYIFVYGTATYADGSACSDCLSSFTYDNNLAGSNTTNSAGSYNFTFSISADGNYSFRVQTTDNYGNAGSNATTMSIKTRPDYVKFRFSYALGTAKTNDVYKIGTAGNISGLIGSGDISVLQYSSNLTHGYVCTYDNTEYPDGLSISLIHSYKGSYLDYVNFSASSSNTNYTLELRNKIDGSNLILAYTKGTCDNIDSKMYLVEKQSIPSTSFSTFSYGGPVQYSYEIRTDYDRIQINGSERWRSGSFKICIQKTGVSSANKPVVDVGIC